MLQGSRRSFPPLCRLVTVSSQTRRSSLELRSTPYLLHTQINSGSVEIRSGSSPSDKIRSKSDKICRNHSKNQKKQISSLVSQNRIQEAIALCLRHRSLPSALHLHSLLPSPLPTPLSNRLLHLFSKCNSLPHAHQLFDQMPQPDTCSFNTLISAYSLSGNLSPARHLFDRMPSPDHFSFSSLISAYSRHSLPSESLSLFRRFSLSHPPNRFVSSSALSALSDPLSARQIHAHLLRSHLLSSADPVLFSSLSDTYARCRNLPYARRVFELSPDRDVVSWTAMIGRYFGAKRRDEGFSLFAEMLFTGTYPNDFTYAAVLDACADVAAEGVGRQVHAHMIRSGSDPSSFAAAAVVHMYSKCGNVEKARAVFELMPRPDLVSWTALVSGYAQNGRPGMALEFFDRMVGSGVKPDHVTFVGVLSACTHAGLVDRGVEIFNSIRDEFVIEYTADHYACVVDLLSRAGRFREVEEIISKMPMKPDEFLWASLLGGCRIHKNVKLAERAAEALFEIEPENAATYVTLANIYASCGNWEGVEMIRKRMDGQGVVKKPGSSWIEVRRKVHVFLVGDCSHPRTRDIYSELDRLYKRMQGEGYVPDTSYVLHDVEEEQKEQNLTHHSEKLAVAFGILETPKGMPIKVFKNLRICGDCHTAIKYISKIAERVIVVRDSSRFHHFRDGVCSCGDYW